MNERQEHIKKRVQKNDTDVTLTLTNKITKSN